jgi:two-component system chemotaxis response regulator CheB
LELGAVDVVGKPTGAIGSGVGFPDLIPKVKAAASARVRTVEAPSTYVAPAGSRFSPDTGHIIAIGSSTGGVEALIAIISQFPENCPPTVITQHMPAGFTNSFAARLDRMSAAKVSEAEDGAVLTNGQIFIAPGGQFHLEVTSSMKPRCKLVDGPLVNGHKPSVDVLFNSVAKLNRPTTGVILTGMGRDGADGLLALRQAGATTIGQDESTSVVYGMPRIAHEIGAVERQLPLRRIAPAILASCTLNSLQT